MTYKKTWTSYLLWAVYTCVVGVILADYAILLWQKKINTVIGYGTIVFVFLIFAGVSGGYFLIRKALSIYHKQDNNTKEKKEISSRTAMLWEVFITLSIFFAGLLYRLYLYLQSAPDAVVMTQYCQAALRKAGEGVEPMAHGASYLYTLCLSFVFSFLGNKAAAAVWLQMLLQMLTILLSFFAVKKTAGSIPACVTMFTLAVSSVYTSQIFVPTPESLFFLLYLAGLFIIGSCVRMYCGGEAGAAAAVAGALLSGIGIGVLTYLDAVSLTLLFFLPALFTGIRRRADAKFSSTKISALFFILILAAGGLSFLGMLSLDAFYSKGEISQAAETWLVLYRSHIAADYVFYRTETSIMECFVLTVLAALYIMAFWNRRKEQNASPWICLMFVLAPTPLTATGVLSSQVYAVFIWSVLAGIGLQQSFVWQPHSFNRGFVPDIATPQAEELPATAPFALEPPATELPATAPPALEPHVPEPLAPEPPALETPAPEASVPEPPAALPDIEFEPLPEPVPAPRFIENPLPLPKKHEKRTMDYQYEVAEDKMYYDVKVKENDDFDIS